MFLFRAANGLRRIRARLSAALACALLAGGFGLAAAPQVHAQQAEPLVIAILDVQDILREAAAGRSLQSEIQKREQALKAELEKRENALLAADQQLAQQRGSLSSEEFAQKRNELAKQLAELRNYRQTQSSAIATLARKGETQLLQALVQIVAEIAEARDITLVLNRQQVVIAPNEMDITQEAMAQLDAKLPSVDLTQ